MFSVYGAILLAALALAVTRAQDLVIVEDSDPSISYSNESQWNSVADVTYWHGGSARGTNITGASMSFVFNGSHIAYYGEQSTDHGVAEIDLDGQKTAVVSFRAAGPVPQVKLFEGSVDPNQPNHRITLTCVENTWLSFDYFEYTRAVPTLSPGSTTTHSTGQNSTPIIVGATVAGLVACGVLAALAFWLCRRRQRERPAKGGLDFGPRSRKPARDTQPSAQNGSVSDLSTPYDRPTAAHKSVS